MVRGALHWAKCPLRDFQSYDPGRYYWISCCSIVTGTGVLGLRVAVSLFQVVGLTFGILALRRVIRSWWGLGLAGIMLLVWTYPWHKVFEHSLTMAAVFFAVTLVERPSRERHFAAGVYVGLAAFFGRNHGLYCLLAYLALILMIHLKERKATLPGSLVLFGAGIGTGYAPMLVMIAAGPGFFRAFWESILDLFRLKTTNLPLPVPWPWSINFSGMDVIQAASVFSTGVFYVLLPIFYGVAAILILISGRVWHSRKKIIIASVIVGVAYIHHTFSRAGLSHLAQGIHPFLMGVISLPFLVQKKLSKSLSWGLLALVIALTCVTVVTVSPYYQMAAAPEGTFTELEVSGSRLQVYRSTAELVRSVERIHAGMDSEARMLIAPHWPGFYPVLNQPSPVWEIYFLFPEAKDRQERMIRHMEKKDVNWVILGDVPLDGRNELRFKNTHELLWRYIMNNFKPVPAEGLPWNYQLLKRHRENSGL